MLVKLQTANSLIYAELNKTERVTHLASKNRIRVDTCYAILHEIEARGDYDITWGLADDGYSDTVRISRKVAESQPIKQGCIMKSFKIEDADVVAIAARIKKIAPNLPNSDTSYFYQPPAIRVLSSVLSLGLRYETVVGPKLEAFEKNHPNIQQITELADFIAIYPTPLDFLIKEIGINNEIKANAIDSLVKYLCGVIEKSPTISEEAAVQQWAIEARPQDCYEMKIKGFKIAGIQWLRMLFGAQTSKPDVHIKRYLRQTLNREVGDIESILLMEAAVSRLGLPIREVDHLIWEIMSE